MAGGRAPASGTPRAHPSGRTGLLPLLLPPCLSLPGSQPWASRMGTNLVSQGHQPAVLLGPRPGNGHVLGFGCFPGLERKQPLPRDALCFPWTVLKPCPWGSEGPNPALGCTQSLSSHCAAKNVLDSGAGGPRLPFSCQVPSCLSGIRAGDQGTGQGCGCSSQRGAASPLLAARSCSQPPLPEFRASGMPAGGSHSRDDGAAGAQQTSAKPPALPLTLHLCVGRSCAMIQAAPGHGPPFVCSVVAGGGPATAANVAVKSGSGSHCAGPQDGPGGSAAPGPHGAEMLRLSVIPARAAPNTQTLLKLAFRAPVGFSA